jgi:hypothetical protein
LDQVIHFNVGIGASKLVSQFIIAILMEDWSFQFTIPELNQTSSQVYAVCVGLVDVSQSFVVQIRLGVRDSAFFPNNEMLTTIIGFPQDANKDGLRRNAKDALSLDVLTLAEESGCFS